MRALLETGDVGWYRELDSLWRCRIIDKLSTQYFFVLTDPKDPQCGQELFCDHSAIKRDKV